jgi:predicted TPR repeat methyltransferase
MVGDIERVLDGSGYGLVIAADTLVYLGDLEPVLRAARACLSGDGHFLFTVEAGEGDGFAMGPKRRWRHSESYLRHIAPQTGFALAGLVAASPRREKGEPVEGFAAAFAAV